MGRKGKKHPPDSRSRASNRPSGSPSATGRPSVDGARAHPAVVPIVCACLLLAVVLVFAKTVSYEFVNYDNAQLVSDNPQVARGLTAQGVVWAFTTAVAKEWYPLTWISYMLDRELYGPQPWGYHLTNVLLHAATSVVLFLVLRRMTGSLWASALVALLFAIHPLAPNRWPGWASGRAP